MNKSSSNFPDKNVLVNLYRQALAENVQIDYLNQKLDDWWSGWQATRQQESVRTQTRADRLKHRLPWWQRLGALLLPIGLVSIGLFLVGNAIIPIVGYYLTTWPELMANKLTTPIPVDQILETNPLVISTSSLTNIAKAADELNEITDNSVGPTIIDSKLDYTNLANWFTADQQSTLLNQTGDNGEYLLDIPKLEIDRALVKLGGTDLSRSLIQYPGTAEPGEAGAPVVFGHSVLRQFYNPSDKNPRRYTSIFSTIMTLQKGDEIFITKEGVKYRYVVSDKTEVKPEDVYILTQRYDVRQLKLVTCTPEGTYLRRGVVTAQLMPV